MKRRIMLACAGLAMIPAAPAAGLWARESGAPLSAEALLRLPQYRSVDLSPDGTLVAVAYIYHGNRTGVRVIDLAPHRTTEMAPADALDASLASWSPDGSYLAFASDNGTGLRLRIWDRRSGDIREFENLKLSGDRRQVEWFADSKRFVVLVTPDSDPAQANEEPEGPGNGFRPPFDRMTPAGTKLHVFMAARGDRAASSSPETGKTRGHYPCARHLVGQCDLAIGDVRDGSHATIARGIAFGYFYKPSPDGKFVAYSAYAGPDPKTLDAVYDLHAIEMATGADRTIALRVHPLGGAFFSWSPSSDELAYPALRLDTPSRSSADPMITTIRGETSSLHRSGEAAIRPGTILWSADAARLYAIGTDGAVWQSDRRTGEVRKFAAPADQNFVEIVAANEADLATTRSPEGAIWVKSDGRDGTAALFEIDTGRGAIAPLMTQRQRSLGNIDSSPACDCVTFLASEPQRPRSMAIWQRGRGVRLLEQPDQTLDARQLGTARVVHWTSASGANRSGALLLPPLYKAGDRLPLVVWVYGGENGSEHVNIFGFNGGGVSFSITYNLQVLASRGYAVLFPDIPLRPGTPLQDTLDAVVPGIESLIASGYVDKERIAVMGHSYGSYASLALITRTSLFKAAILSGVLHPDLLSYYLHLNSNGNGGERWVETGQGLMHATPWEAPERYRENSPIYDFDKIDTPVLIGQGELDPLTPLGANAVFVALRRLGKPVEYRFYQGEGHGISKPGNIIDFWDRRLLFLAENLDIALDDQGRLILEGGHAKSRSK